MVMFKGFKTKKEAQDFIEQHGGGRLCYEKSDIEARGKTPQDYRDCVLYGGLSKEYKYAVQYAMPKGECEI